MNSKRKSNHAATGMNHAKAQGKGAGFNEEGKQNPRMPEEIMNNQKRKKNQ
ncbi:small acid-soluble spore protein O [Pontibacillus salicampi]|uniref:Small acid-soluble spore protein O n=1 Tax=Pontibacillus salicampi TaxID=1449801 RepID=A0ABV6LRF8_9BACI